MPEEDLGTQVGYYHGSESGITDLVYQSRKGLTVIRTKAGETTQPVFKDLQDWMIAPIPV